VNPKRSQVDRLEDGSWMPDVSGVENRMRRILIIRIRLKGWILDAGGSFCQNTVKNVDR